MRCQHCGADIHELIDTAYRDGVAKGVENARIQAVRGMWQTRIRDLNWHHTRAADVAVFEVRWSSIYPPPRRLPEEVERVGIVRALAHEIAKHVKIEKSEDGRVLTARVALATVECAALPPVPYPLGFATFNDRGDAVWHAF